MIAQQTQTQEVVTIDDLKALAGASGPCISVMQSIPNPLELRARFRNVIRALQNECETRGIPVELLDPIQDLTVTFERNREWANTLAIFRAPDVFQSYWLRAELRDSLDVAGRFQVRPLFELMAMEQSFHLLILNQKEVRLRNVTPHRIEEVDLGTHCPVSFAEFLNIRQPDHRLENWSTNGPATGSMKSATFGSGTEREREDHSLRHFFVRINQAVKDHLRGSSDPLVIAGVDHDAAIYRQINTYPRLVERAIFGANFSGQDLFQRAWEVVRESRPEPLEKAFADFDRHSNHKQVTTHSREAIKAAFEGRVADLFFTPLAKFDGVYDERTHRVRKGEEEDLVNAAALQTVLQGGRAFQLRPSDMPVPAELVATLRFAK